MKYILQVKNYGDLVIALNYLQNVNENCYTLICASHLREIIKEFNFKIKVIYLNDEFYNRPLPLYNLKKSTIFSIIKSLIFIKKEIEKIVKKNDLIIFDKTGLREKLISWPIKNNQIFKNGKNIYLDYENFFKEYSNNFNYSISKNNKKISIFPDASREEKKIPLDILFQITKKFEEKGYRYALYFFQKNDIYKNFENSEIYNSFDQLLEIIKDSSIIISSDSLCGHLSEFYRLRNFIFLKKPNLYWLPKSSYINKSYGLFHEVDKCIKWVESSY